ncbi:MAG: ABC transporter ATP-binding protein [Candidatus Thorarchaeota archaeon]|jgi:ABC-2 type transport system ATP-binding protein
MNWQTKSELSISIMLVDLRGGMILEYAVSVDCVSKQFRSSKQITAVDAVSFDVEYGTIVGLLGANGAGKTTLIRMMTTLLSPTSGQIHVRGYDAKRNPSRIREYIGYAGQDTERSLYYRLTPRENAKYFGWLRGLQAETAIERLDHFANQIAMEDRLDQHFITLSGGEKQVFVVLRALLHQPEIVFLDEPSKSLDVLTSRRIRTLLKEYVSEHNATIIVTSHNLKELEDVCERLIFINRGRKVFEGTPQELKQTPMKMESIVIRGGPFDDTVVHELSSVGEPILINNGTELRIAAVTPYATIRRVVDILEAHEVRAFVAMSEPTLEDAFEELAGESRDV